MSAQHMGSHISGSIECRLTQQALSRKRGLAVLRAATHILVTISPSSTEDPCPVMYILGREIKEIAENAQWVGYLSR